MCYIYLETEKKKDELIANREYVPLLTWKFVNDKMAWGVLLLMGGGFAVADGCEVSIRLKKKPDISKLFIHREFYAYFAVTDYQ